MCIFFRVVFVQLRGKKREEQQGHRRLGCRAEATQPGMVIPARALDSAHVHVVALVLVLVLVLMHYCYRSVAAVVSECCGCVGSFSRLGVVVFHVGVLSLAGLVVADAVGLGESI